MWIEGEAVRSLSSLFAEGCWVVLAEREISPASHRQCCQELCPSNNMFVVSECFVEMSVNNPPLSHHVLSVVGHCYCNRIDNWCLCWSRWFGRGPWSIRARSPCASIRRSSSQDEVDIDECIHWKERRTAALQTEKQRPMGDTWFQAWSTNEGTTRTWSVSFPLSHTWSVRLEGDDHCARVTNNRSVRPIYVPMGTKWEMKVLLMVLTLEISSLDWVRRVHGDCTVHHSWIRIRAERGSLVGQACFFTW